MASHLPIEQSNRHPGSIHVRSIARAIFLSLIVASSIACSELNPFHRDAEIQNIGPGEWHSLVVYFKSGATDEQISTFMHNALLKPRLDGRGEDFKEGIGMYVGLQPDQAHGHRGFAITFYKRVTDEQRSMIIELIKSDPLVYRVFENIAPNQITVSDLQR